MMNLEELLSRKHIFVFFSPGTGGSFIGCLLAGLYNCKKDITISASGNAHSYALADPISNWGSMPGAPNYPDVNIKRWVSGITRDATNPYPVTVSHSFYTIPQALMTCPNGKFLIITAETLKEKVVASIMLLRKYLFSENSPNVQDKLLHETKINITNFLRKLNVDEKVITFLISIFSENRFDPKYLNLLYWSLLSEKYHRLQLNSDDFYHEPIGYIPDYFNRLPFSTILNHDVKRLIDTVQKCFDEELTVLQREYITRNFDNYHRAQEQELIRDPDEYFRLLEENAMKQLEELKNTLP